MSSKRTSGKGGQGGRRAAGNGGGQGGGRRGGGAGEAGGTLDSTPTPCVAQHKELMQAVIRGDLRAAKKLLKKVTKKAGAPAVPAFLNRPDQEDWTVLQRAAYQGHTQLAELFLDQHTK